MASQRMVSSSVASAIFALALLSIASGFVTNDLAYKSRCSIPRISPCISVHSECEEVDAGDDANISPSDHYSHSSVNRREWLASQIATSSAVFLGSISAYAEGGSDVTSTTSPPASSRIVSRNKSVIVLGANGGTGRECVSAILASGRPCVATTRSGMFNYEEDGGEDSVLLRSNPNLQEAKADVTRLDSLLSMVDQFDSKTNNIGAMIFAASASVKGKTPGVNDAFTVDCQGVINAAQCCIQRNIHRLVIVSSGAVTRPNSAVYKLLNFVGGGIMEAKIQGEDAVRDLYHDTKLMDKGLGYTIVRPGGLTTDPVPLGPSFLEVNQGDDKSGRLSRADVAGICVACLENTSAFDATFECYEKNTAKPVENVGLSNILKLTDPTSYKSGREGVGDTWGELLGGLQSDFV